MRMRSGRRSRGLVPQRRRRSDLWLRRIGFRIRYSGIRAPHTISSGTTRRRPARPGPAEAAGIANRMPALCAAVIAPAASAEAPRRTAAAALGRALRAECRPELPPYRARRATAVPQRRHCRQCCQPPRSAARATRRNGPRLTADAFSGLEHQRCAVQRPRHRASRRRTSPPLPRFPLS